MCGRYTLTIEQEALQVALGVSGLLHPRPRYNVAPTQVAPVLLREGDGFRAAALRWGLIPPWAEDPSVGSRFINARSESAHDKPTFRTAFQTGRCLVPADGFYEWKEEGGGKFPYWIHFESGAPFTFAGLCHPEPLPMGGPGSFTILTTEANEFLAPFHHRMPVILGEAERAQWMDPEAQTADLLALLRAHPSEGMVVRGVSSRVNSPRNDDPECLAPEAEGDRPPPIQPDLFR